MAGLDVLMVGPFPVDANRIEGGVQASLYGLCRELRTIDEIAHLEVIAPPSHAGGEVFERVVDGIPVTFLDTPFRFHMSAVAHTPRLLRMLGAMERPLVHLHGSGLFELAVMLACLWKRIPIVWTMHGITEKENWEAWQRDRRPATFLRWLLYRTCERLQLRLAHELIVDTAYVAREIDDRVLTVPHIIPQGIFPDELAAARASDRPGHVVLALGVLHPRKGHRQTLEAFAKVLKRVPDARLTIAGSLTSAAYFAELQDVGRALGLDDHVEILPDRTRAEVLGELARARVFALHSEEESQGIALCEAMSVGLPVVATTAGGIPDVIADSGAGLLVPFGDIDGFADHIVRLLNDDALHTRMSAAALRRSVDFDWKTIAARVVECYRAARATADAAAAPAPMTTLGRPRT